MSSIARPLTRGLSPWVPIAALVVALAAVAGAWLWGRSQAAAGAGAARSASERALAAEEAVDELSGELTRELSALETQLDNVTADRKQLNQRFERVTSALWASLKKIRTDLAAARSGSRDALARVDEAAAEAQNAARQLSVLEDRFEYHLRQDHGGG